ncbi:MAG: ABC transporter permease [Sphingomonadales bacterium]|nr:ABC transporter permease [Sphingomonadales bacterium]MDE2569271.1 ABC transporter permease [Sphingomonadales bacterium]
MADPKASWKRLRKGWGIQVRVIHALIIRELNTRYGRENIGFLWIMVEPLMFASLVALIWRYMRGPEEHGVGIVPFIITGYIPITLFRHAVSRSIMIFQVNSSLMYHRQIQILDFVFVRFLIEMLGGMMGFVFISTMLGLFGLFPMPQKPLMLIAGWMLYSVWTLSLCIVTAPLSEMSEVLEKVLPVTTYIMIPFSGLFTLSAWLSPTFRQYMLWSPFVNAMEMIRYGVWGDSIKVYYDVWNPIYCTMAATAIGLPLCRYVRRIMPVE